MSVYAYSIPDGSNGKVRTVYYQQLRHKNYLTIRVLLSKSQRNKFLKYGTIPKLPKNPVTISNFGNLRFQFKKSFATEQYKKYGLHKLHFHGQTYTVRLLRDVNVFESWDVIQDMFLKHLFR